MTKEPDTESKEHVVSLMHKWWNEKHMEEEELPA